MRARDYLLCFLLNPLNIAIHRQKSAKFYKSRISSINNTRVYTYNFSNPVNKLYSISNNNLSSDNAEEDNASEINTLEETPLSDLYINPNIDTFDFADTADYDQPQNLDFIPDLNDLDTNAPSNSTNFSQEKSNESVLNETPESVIPTSIYPAESGNFTEIKRIGPQKQKNNIFARPGKRIVPLIQNRAYKIAKSQVAAVHKKPKKLIQSVRSGNAPENEQTGVSITTNNNLSLYEGENTPVTQSPNQIGKDFQTNITKEFAQSPKDTFQSKQAGLKPTPNTSVSGEFDVVQDNSSKKTASISTASTWDISPSELRVKGAYFIQRYVQELREPFKKHDADTGSVETQVAALTARIDYMIEHVKKAPKDISAKLKLLKLAHRRRKNLAYLFRTNKESFNKLVCALKLYFDKRPYTYEKLLPDYIYRKRNSTKREYTKEGRSKPIVVNPARFDNITIDMLISENLKKF